jgi:hypothetical protein
MRGTNPGGSVVNMKRALACASLVAIAGVLAGFPALADTVAPGAEGELTRFLPPEPGKRACFSRVYDADHLARHPKQKVTEIEFRLAYHRFDPDEFFPEGQRNYYFEVLAKVRGNKKLLTAMGECSPGDKKISCSVDCDGGGMLAERSDKPGKILMSFGFYYGLRMTAGCGEDEEGDTVMLEPGEDDKEFLLSEKSACPAYEEW